MSDRPEDTPAFPPNAGWRDNDPNCRGTTLRQWYAGQALPALITGHLAEPNNFFDAKGIAVAAEEAFEFADAMIAEGEKP